jgi:hypothetical protein
MVTVDCDSATLCGPVDSRVVRVLADRHSKVLDPSYLAFVEQHNGGVPVRQFFTDARGMTHRIGRFLPLFDNRSELPRPFRPSLKFPQRDARIEWGVLTLIEEDSPSAWWLFGGERLVPFAALYRGVKHPDTLSLVEGDVNLLTFVYAQPDARPCVAVWLAQQARDEYERWSCVVAGVNPCEHDEPVRYDAFTVPVAADFENFLAGLRERPTEQGPGGERLHQRNL